MKKLALLVCLLAIGGLGVMGNACGSSGSVRPGGDSGGEEEAGGDAGSSSGSSSGSDATTSSSSGSDASSSSSGGSSSGSSGGDSSALCGVVGEGCAVPFDALFLCGSSADSVTAGPPNTGVPCCDQCIEGCCAPDWCTCAGDSGFDDAGQPTGCLAFVACVQSCLDPPADSGVDGGTPTVCVTQCSPSYSMNQVQEGSALLTCIIGSCASPSLCGQ